MMAAGFIELSGIAHGPRKTRSSALSLAASEMTGIPPKHGSRQMVDS